MDAKQHLEYLSFLEQSYGKGHMSFPKKEGAFYWGGLLTHDEYVDNYRYRCVKNGWVLSNKKNNN